MQRVMFRSKLDGWLAVILVASALASVAAVVGVGVARPPVSTLVAAPILLLGAVLPMWLMGATDYAFDGPDLRIRSGPFRWKVPLREIRSARRTRNPLSSPALSLDRLRLEYGSKSIMISPRDQEAFLAELAKRAPALDI